MRQDQLEMLKGLWDREGVPYECGTPLARYTTFKIGGPAALFARPADARQLEAALAACKKSDVRYYLLGQGSNTLFADEGFDGAVICTRMMGAVYERRCLWRRNEGRGGDGDLPDPGGNGGDPACRCIGVWIPYQRV